MLQNKTNSVPMGLLGGGGDMPVTKVVLYKHGAASFVRTGTVEEDGKVVLHFKDNQMNDVLKTLTVDDSKGTVSSISYENNDPQSRRLNEAMSLDAHNSWGSLISQCQGATARVDILVDQKQSMIEGTVMGEYRRTSVVTTPSGGRSNVTEQCLTLFDTEEAQVINIPVSNICRFNLLDSNLRRELNKFLSLKRSFREKNGKTVTIYTRGNSRDVSISYTIESPIFKVSYRLILAKQDSKESESKSEETQEKQNTVKIQGWAVVDNVTDEDWNDIQLTLVAGQPHSYETDLFTPTYKKRREAPQAPQPPQRQHFPPQQMQQQMQQRIMPRGRESRAARPQAMNFAAAPPQAMAAPQAMPVPASAPAALDVKTATDQLGENLFSYEVGVPVNVRSCQSALVPIVETEASGELIVKWNSDRMGAHPHSAVLFTNTTGLTLEGGPMTVLENLTYVGESNLPTVKPGEVKPIEFGTEVGITIWKTTKNKKRIFKSLLADGRLTFHRWEILETTYNIRSSLQKDTIAYIDHKFLKGEWETFDTPKPTNPVPITYQIYRVQADADKVTKFVVSERRTTKQVIALTSLTENTYSLWVDYIDKKAHPALEQSLKLHAKNAELQRLANTIGTRINRIQQGHNRIRQNLTSLSTNTDQERKLRADYVTQLANDEMRIREMEAEQTALQEAAAKVSKEQQELLTAISAEHVIPASQAQEEE